MSDPVITRLNIKPSYAGGFQFAWTINPGFATGKTWLFTIQLGETDEGPWNDLSPVLKNTYVWQAPPTLIAITKMEILYYRVAMQVGAERFYSPIVSPYGTFNRRDFLMDQEIMRKEVLMADVSAGIEAQVWHKSVFGPYCDHCRDFASGSIQDGQCKYCYGTGHIPGYYGPYGVWASFSVMDHQKMMQADNTEMKELWMTKARVIGAEDMNKDDILVDTRLGKYYYVDEHEHVAEIRRVTVVQELSLRELAISEAVYKLGLQTK